MSIIPKYQATINVLFSFKTILFIDVSSLTYRGLLRHIRKDISAFRQLNVAYSI